MKLTQEYIESRIVKKSYVVPTSLDKTTITVCVLTLDNGFSAVGSSACIHKEDYEKEIGKEIAYKKALDQLWMVMGYHIKESQYQLSK